MDFFDNRIHCKSIRAGTTVKFERFETVNNFVVFFNGGNGAAKLGLSGDGERRCVQ